MELSGPHVLCVLGAPAALQHVLQIPQRTHLPVTSFSYPFSITSYPEPLLPFLWLWTILGTGFSAWQSMESLGSLSPATMLQNCVPDLIVYMP